jgi:CO dehydrogenase maturation factor
MTYTIAVAGKGGTGKTTLSGMIIEYLSHHGKTPILAVDADANSNLNEVWGWKWSRPSEISEKKCCARKWLP